MNENVGDALNYLHRFQRDPQNAVHAAGIYIERLCDSVIQLVETIDNTTDYQSLKIIGVQSVKEKMV